MKTRPIYEPKTIGMTPAGKCIIRRVLPDVGRYHVYWMDGPLRKCDGEIAYKHFSYLDGPIDMELDWGDGTIE